MMLSRTLLRGSTRVPVLFTVATTVTLSMIIYASHESSPIHIHALDNYNDNFQWAVDRASALNPFTNGRNSRWLAGWEIGRDGKLVVPVDDKGNVVSAIGPSSKARHPMYDLMNVAEKKWEKMVSRQSKTLKEAVKEYQRRYKRLPPKGFDKWYDFASNNDVMLIDEFDQINYDILPYLALSPTAIRSRITELEELPTSFHIQVLAGDLQMYGVLDEDDRALDVAELIQDFSHLLPDLIMHASGHDTGSVLFSPDMRQQAERLVARGEHFSPENVTYFEDKKRNRRKTLTNACVPESAAVLQESGVIPKASTKDSAEFIFDHRGSMDFCDNPALLQHHGAFIYDGARKSEFSPFFVYCKLQQGGEILMPALAGYADRGGQMVLPWAQRTSKTIFWRGRTTGNHFNNEYDWRKSHRIRLNSFANRKDGDVPVLVEDPVTRLLSMRNFSRAALNEEFMDVGLVGPPTQCQNDGTCEEMSSEIDFRKLVAGTAGSDHKYALDVGKSLGRTFRTYQLLTIDLSVFGH
ncbi:F-actin-capping protein subunit alpha [Tulasnella sp. 331]|nr:F-actin-capping protein subunit alpha [Tulasnella sp. 331]